MRRQVSIAPAARSMATCSARAAESDSSAMHCRALAGASQGTSTAASAGSSSPRAVSAANRHGTPASPASNGTSPNPSLVVG